MDTNFKQSHLTLVLCFIFFISGASALMFESIWFHQAGLNLGNSIWATSIVLAAFMAGLALGNGLIAAIGSRFRYPLWIYVIIEILIAVFGLIAILLFSKSIDVLTPIYSLLFDRPVLINLLRAIVAFCFMLIPTIAMGMTLPLIVKVMYDIVPNFGKALGLLYGCNTLGALIGVLVNELFLVKYLGIWGAGSFAAFLNIVASFTLIFVLLNKTKSIPYYVSKSPVSKDKAGRPFFSSLIGSFFSGLILLSLEVVWFRFIILFFNSHSWNFAIMLATVLAGISIGGFIGSRFSEKYSRFHNYLFYLFLMNGVIVILTYSNFSFVLSVFQIFRTDRFLPLVAIYLMLPVSIISGLTFTMLGNIIHSKGLSEYNSTSVLTASNTIGAMVGALIGGFILIPYFGVENSFLLLAVLYGLTGCLFLSFAERRLVFKKVQLSTLTLTVFLVVCVSFPFGVMENSYINISSELYANSTGEKRVYWKEGRSETIQYMEKSIGDTPHYHRLITNNYSMSATSKEAKRYMKFFVYWPVSLLKSPGRALLICFGSGSTAKALVDTKALSEIDIVDISKDIFELSNVVYPDPQKNPLNDPRVTTIVEDGRFFLQTVNKKYDIITAEPPPPSFNGVGNLYTQEYFKLIHNKLNYGGVATYWLPVYQLKPTDSKAIIKAFCNEFNDCSIWSGGGLEWMLAGTKGLQGRNDDESFSKQWEDEIVGKEMMKLGFLNPEQFGSTFVADGKRLADWVGATKPLVDNYPHRLSPVNRKWQGGVQTYLNYMNSTGAVENFLNSENIRNRWPNTLINASKDYFSTRHIVNDLLQGQGMARYSQLFKLHHCIYIKPLRHYIPWSLGSDYDAIEIIESMLNRNDLKRLYVQENLKHLIALAVMRGDFELAEKIAEKKSFEGNENAAWANMALRIYFLVLLDDSTKLDRITSDYIEQSRDPKKSKKNVDEVINWSKKVLFKT